MRILLPFLWMPLFLILAGTAWADCSTPAASAGTWEYFTDDDSFKFCNGTVWIDVLDTDNLGNHTATQTLDMDGHAITNSGDITLAPGASLDLDILLGTATLSTNPPSAQTNLSCTHNGGWPPVYTQCTCPSGYYVISGGTYGVNGQKLLRESRPATLTSWNVACLCGL